MHFVSNTTRRTVARSTGVLVAVAAALLSACSTDSLTQPDVAPKNGLISDVLGALIPVKALSRDTAIKVAYTRSFTFDKKGGSIDMPETGLRVDVPAGAIPGSTLTIVVTALPGKSIAYDFQPHGTVFLMPLTFRHDLSNTSWDKSLIKGVVNGGYFKSTSQLNLSSGTGLLDELLGANIVKKEVSFSVKHFSGYMVSGGRKGASEESDF